ncbi:MAG TPA: phosphotransferase [Actinomycetes bacterium]
MLEPPPDLAAEAVVRALERGYGIRVAEVEFLPIGNDPASWAYRVGTPSGRDWFLKVRAGAMPGAVVPALLHRQGVPNVLAPLPATGGAPAVALERFTLALYPMLDAVPGGVAGVSAAQWRQLGAAVERIHTLPVPAELARLLGRERFRPSRRELLPELERLLARPDPDDPLALELADIWHTHEKVIHALIERADRQGPWLARAGFPKGLCHGDLHTWNVLVDADQQLWIVDWDEAVLAPRERDLMFVVGGIAAGMVSPEDTRSFFQGYGEACIDPVLLAYYRCAWALQDIATTAEEALLSPQLGEVSRRKAVAGFRSLFEPGNIVDLASPAVSQARRRI